MAVRGGYVEFYGSGLSLDPMSICDIVLEVLDS